MPFRLKNLDVQWISLVRNPANGLPLLLKDANAKPFRVLKTDEERRIVYGIVYAPDRVDSQGDFADRFEIERAAHAFLKSNRGAQVDANHEFEALPGAYVAESWIVRDADPEFADWLPHAWAVGIKIEDEALWTAVKAGEYSGLSLAGKAEREPVTAAPAPESSTEAAGVSKAEFAALCRVVEAIATSLAEPTPPAELEKTSDPDAELEKTSDPDAELEKTSDPDAELEKTSDPDADFSALSTRLENLLRAQTQLADRLLAVEKQRLSADHAPPAPPKNWLREVL